MMSALWEVWSSRNLQVKIHSRKLKLEVWKKELYKPPLTTPITINR